MIRTALGIALILTIAAGAASCGLMTATFSGDAEDIRSNADHIGKQVVQTYQQIEESVVGEYQRIEDAFVEAYLK